MMTEILGDANPPESEETEGPAAQQSKERLDAAREPVPQVRDRGVSMTGPDSWLKGLDQSGDRPSGNNGNPYEPPPGDSALSPVGAAVKRGADHKTRTVLAGGDDTWKRRHRYLVAEQPRDGAPV
jgi:hypothetical protein